MHNNFWSKLIKLIWKKPFFPLKPEVSVQRIVETVGSGRDWEEQERVELSFPPRLPPPQLREWQMSKIWVLKP